MQKEITLDFKRWDKVTNIDRCLFSGLNLTSITFFNSKLTQLDPALFYGHSKLKTLSLSNNKLASLDSNLFNGLDELQTLKLSSNKLASLHPKIFNGLEYLKYLDLSNNQLTSLDPKIFNGLENLHTLHLEKNKLNYLDANLFKELHNLELLFLNSNHFESASQFSLKRAFSAIPTRMNFKISLEGNSIVNTIYDLQSLCGTNNLCKISNAIYGFYLLFDQFI